MPYNTKAIKKDVDNKPIPQIFNPAVDDYEPLQGRNGAQRIEIYGPDGNPISTTSGKLDVRASEIETLLSTLGGKDFATQTTLAAILAKIISAPATEAKQDALIAKDFATQTTLAAILAKLADPATQTTLTAVLAKLEAGIDTTLTGSYVEIGGVTFAVSGGDTLRNTATNKPDAATAHAAIPFCYYHAVDTGVIEVTDGTNWVVI